MLKRFQLIVFWFGMLAVLCMSCGKKKTTEPKVGPPVDILFVTHPPGARVYFDDDSVGVTRAPDDPAGPLRLKEIPWGEHRYVIMLEGYKTYAGNMNICSSSTKRVELELLKLLGIEILTSPPGAEVYLDGQEQEGVTPLTIENMPEGGYTVEVCLEGYFRAGGEVTITKEAGGGSFYEVLEPLPVVKEVRIGIIDQETNTIKEEYTGEPFTQKYFEMTPNNKGMYVQAEIILAESLRQERAFSVELLWTPLRESKQEVVDRGSRTLKEGENVLRIWLRNADNVEAKSYVQAGDYVVKVYIEGNLMCEQSFSVKK